MTDPALALPLDQALELHHVLTCATDHLIHGRISSQLLYDLGLNAARLELALGQALHHDNSKEAQL